MGKLTKMKCLYLQENALTGTLATELRKMIMLQGFEVEVNRFTGSIPMAAMSRQCQVMVNPLKVVIA